MFPVKATSLKHLSCFPGPIVRCMRVRCRFWQPCKRYKLSFVNTRDSKTDWKIRTRLAGVEKKIRTIAWACLPPFFEIRQYCKHWLLLRCHRPLPANLQACLPSPPPSLSLSLSLSLISLQGVCQLHHCYDVLSDQYFTPRQTGWIRVSTPWRGARVFTHAHRLTRLPVHLLYAKCKIKITKQNKTHWTWGFSSPLVSASRMEAEERQHSARPDRAHRLGWTCNWSSWSEVVSTNRLELWPDSR